MDKDNFKVFKNIAFMIIFVLLFIIFFCLLIATKDNRLIKDIKEYIKTDTKVLYISNKKNYSGYPIKLFDKYDLQYLYVDSTSLSKFEKSKLEKIINSKYISNIIVIYKNEKIVDAIIEYKDEETLVSFLQDNDLIPEEIGNNSKIIENIKELIKTEYTLIYLPYKKLDEIEDQDKKLEKIAKEYEINYKKVDAYLLSRIQQDKLNSILQISTVEDQIVILIKDQKIIGSIRGIKSKRDYLNALKECKFIDEIGYYISHINLNEFDNILSSDEKNVIVIGKDDCKYCDEVNNSLNSIALEYNIKINYINVGKIDSDIAINLENKLSQLGYNDGFTTPMTIIVEKGKLIDYVIGLSTEKYFVEIFTENGIIK